MIHCFGGSSIIAPATVPMSKLDAWDIWSNYIRYIGAGAVAMGGIISLVKSFPTIAKTFRKALGGFGHKEAVQERTNRDLPMKFLLPVAIGLYLPIHLSVPVFIGGLIRNFFDKKGEDGKAITEKGILYTSGLIAGEGLIGVLLAIFALIRLSNGKTLLKTINMGNVLGMPGSVVFFVLLLASIVFFTRNKKKNA